MATSVALSRKRKTALPDSVPAPPQDDALVVYVRYDVDDLGGLFVRTRKEARTMGLLKHFERVTHPDTPVLYACVEDKDEKEHADAKALDELVFGPGEGGTPKDTKHCWEPERRGFRIPAGTRVIQTSHLDLYKPH